MRTLLLWLLTCTACFAQVNVPATVKPFEPIIATCDAPADDLTESKIFWEVSANVRFIDLGGALHIWAPPGTHTLEAIVITDVYQERTVFVPDEESPNDITKAKLEKIRFKISSQVERYKATFTVTGDVPLPPGPNPPLPPGPDVIPSDEFGDLGRQINQWANELALSKRSNVSNNYRIAADRLSGRTTPILPTIDAAIDWLKSENGKESLEEAKWGVWATRVSGEWDKHVKDRTTAARFFELVAIGLKG